VLRIIAAYSIVNLTQHGLLLPSVLLNFYTCKIFIESCDLGRQKHGGHLFWVYYIVLILNFIIRVIKLRMRQAGYVACVGGMRNAYNILVGKPERKRPLWRPRHWWQGNIRMQDLRLSQW